MHRQLVSDSMIFFANERDAPPVEEQATVEALSWRLFLASTGALHLMTYRDGQTVRVTSPVSAVDRKRRTVTTSSGRVYNLRAAPEEDHMAVALLRANAIRVGLLGAIDVSDDAWTELLGHAVGRSLFRSRP